MIHQSSVFQVNVGCFRAGPLALAHVRCGTSLALSVGLAASFLACTTFAASMAAWLITCVFTYCFQIFIFHMLFLICLFETALLKSAFWNCHSVPLTRCNVTHSERRLHHWLLLSMAFIEYIFACVIIYVVCNIYSI